jgi:hypothetical protein
MVTTSRSLSLTLIVALSHPDCRATFRVGAQNPGSHGVRTAGHERRRRRQDRGSGRHVCRRLREAANQKENRRDRRLAKNQNGKRKVVVIVRRRGGRTLPAVFKTEASAQSWIKARVAKGTTIMADEAASWNDLHGRFQVSRINHQDLYSTETGIYTNNAESFFSRLRRSEIGHHHHIAGAYLVRYAQESAWREDHRRVDNGRQTMSLAGLAMMAPTSVDWCGYWQRSAKEA